MSYGSPGMTLPSLLEVVSCAQKLVQHQTGRV